MGYGMLCRGSKALKAHRVSHKMHFGEIPPGAGYHGTCVMHKCDNMICVNPEHLMLGSQQDNIRDRDKKRRRVVPTGEDHWSAISDNTVRAILEASGSQTDIASRFGVSQSTVGRVKNGKRFARPM
jgi:hypothetical protein